MYESSVDGIPKRKKLREWWMYLTPRGDVANVYQTHNGKPMEPVEGDELVLVREVRRDD